MTAEGRACPASTPRDRRSDGVRSVAYSHIAVRLRQPASTPVTARDRTVNRLWRTPRLLRGSVMFLRTWVRGWRDRADVVEDDIGAGSQDEEMTRHHSSSLRGPRPRPSDTPPPSKRLRHPHPPTLPTPWCPGGSGLRPGRPSPRSGGPRWRLGCGGRRGGLSGRACSSANDCPGVPQLVIRGDDLTSVHQMRGDER